MIFKEEIIDPGGRITRLIRWSSYDAEDLIKQCIQLLLSKGYDVALELSEIRYDDPPKV